MRPIETSGCPVLHFCSEHEILFFKLVHEKLILLKHFSQQNRRLLINKRPRPRYLDHGNLNRSKVALKNVTHFDSFEIGLELTAGEYWAFRVLSLHYVVLLLLPHTVIYIRFLL